MSKYKVWNLLQVDKQGAEALALELGVSSLVTGILLNRGLKTAVQMREFLYGNPQVYHDPLLMKDMQKAALRILQAVQGQEQITVYGDYDVDGITASSLLFLYLRKIGAKVNTYIPKRKGEGYGLNIEALQGLSEDGTRLLVTVDCGISGINEVAAAPLALDIIITDHHTPPEHLPAAYAIVNPKQADCAYPFKGLSGVGVAFKLCQALAKVEHPQEPLWEGYTELTALGTVADIVPLKGENRELVKRGLKAMETTALIGLRQLIEVSQCPTTNITSENIGFILAPRLNAVGRLEHAQLAVELLTTREQGQAQKIAEELNRENILRQEISHNIFLEAEAMLAERKQLAGAIVLAKEGWHAGVIGIVASRLVDKYHLPTILISIEGENAKGSCRSIPSLDLYAAIDACSADLIQFGGHRQAAGLTLKTEMVAQFSQDFVAEVERRLQPEDFEPVLSVDAVLDAGEPLSLTLLRQLQLLEPFGCENPMPVFALHQVQVQNPKTFGKESNHLRFFANHATSSYHSIMWNGSKYLACLYNNAVINMAFMPKINVYQGHESINLHVLALNKPCLIYDYRLGNVEKEAFLKKLLQTTPQVAVFVNQDSHLPETFKDYPGLQELYYGQAGVPPVQVAVFYDFPQVPVFTKGEFPLLKGQDAMLFLLFNHGEYRRKRRYLEIYYPERKHLTLVYKFVTNMLRQKFMLGKSALQQQAATADIIITDNDVQIFQELGFLHVEEEHITLGVIKRKELDNSPTYARLREEGKSLLEIYDANFRMTNAQIENIWRERWDAQ